MYISHTAFNRVSIYKSIIDAAVVNAEKHIPTRALMCVIFDKHRVLFAALK